MEGEGGRIFDAKTSFASGELSPLLWGRVDMGQYANGARTIQNFIVLPQGGVTNRPGTKVLTQGLTYDAVRLAPFVFSEDDACCLAFAEGLVDVYNSGGFVHRVEGSPYRTEHLKRLRWLQSADMMYLFHPDVPPHTLLRHSPADWEFKPVVFKNGPFLDMNTEPDKKVWVVGGDPKERTLHSTEDLFVDELVGTLFKMEMKVKPRSYDFRVFAGGDWAEISNVFGPFTYRTSGKWIGTIEVERCTPDDGSWKDPEEWEWQSFKSYTSEDKAEENFAFSGVVEDYPTHFRFRKLAGGTARTTITFNFEGGMIQRIYRITEVVSGTEAKAEDYEDKGGVFPDKTDAWAISSFNARDGYPSLGIFHQERLILAATKTSKQTLWMSQPASWHDFETSIPTKDDDAITITLASKQLDEIRGLTSRGDLLIFTSGGEWSAKAGAKTDAFTPSSIVITPSGYRGSHDVPPLDVGVASLFVQRHGKTVRSLGYSLEIDGYASSDLSILSDHIFENNPIRAWAYQQTPWSVVWCALEDGRVAALTLEQEHKVSAWSQQLFAAGHNRIRDLCCVPGVGQDDLYLAVQKDSVTVEILNHRKDLGAVQPEDYMDSGQHVVHSVLECLQFELPGGNGTLQGRHTQIPVITLRLYRTKGLRGGVVTDERGYPIDIIPFPPDDLPFYNPFLSTFDVRVVVPGGVGREGRIHLENSEPRPVTILGIYPEVVVP